MPFLKLFLPRPERQPIPKIGNRFPVNLRLALMVLPAQLTFCFPCAIIAFGAIPNHPTRTGVRNHPKPMSKASQLSRSCTLTSWRNNPKPRPKANPQRAQKLFATFPSLDLGRVRALFTERNLLCSRKRSFSLHSRTRVYCIGEKNPDIRSRGRALHLHQNAASHPTRFPPHGCSLQKLALLRQVLPQSGTNVRYYFYLILKRVTSLNCQYTIDVFIRKGGWREITGRSGPARQAIG